MLILFVVLSFIFGVVTIIYTGGHYHSKPVLLVISGEVMVALPVSSFFAFFGFVLELLRGIWEETAGEND